jgi:hypothetical protein
MFVCLVGNWTLHSLLNSLAFILNAIFIMSHVAMQLVLTHENGN